MKTVLKVLAPLMAALWVETACAGVVLHELVATSRPGTSMANADKNLAAAQAAPRERIVEVEGNKARVMVAGRIFDIIVDLDTRHTILMHPRASDFLEEGFPPHGYIAAIVFSELNNPPPLTYQKTGKHRTVAGYPCDEYVSTSDRGGFHGSISACYSTQAPGAKEYTAFAQKIALAATVVAAASKSPTAPTKSEAPETQAASKSHPEVSAASAHSIPDGIPLEVKTMLTKNKTPAPAATAQPAASQKSTRTKGPSVKGTKAQPEPAQEQTLIRMITVTSVEEKTLSASEFEPPQGFKRKRPKILGF